MLKSLLRSTLLFLILLSFHVTLWSEETRKNFAGFLTELKMPNWVHVGNNVWLKKYVWNQVPVLVKVLIDEEYNVRMHVSTYCLKSEESDVVLWEYGKSYGVRNTCSSNIFFLLIPPEFERLIGRLPPLVEEVLNIKEVSHILQ
jgi:hypothetical protein